MSLKWKYDIQLFAEPDPAPEPSPTPAPEPTPEPKKEETKLQLTQSEIDKMISDRLAREKTAHEKAIAAAKAEIENKYKVEKMTEEEKAKYAIETTKAEAEAIKQELESLKVSKLRNETAIKYNLPEEALTLLKGSTIEEIEAEIKAINSISEKLWKSKAGGTPAKMSIDTSTTAEQQAIKKAMGLL